MCYLRAGLVIVVVFAGVADAAPDEVAEVIIEDADDAEQAGVNTARAIDLFQEGRAHAVDEEWSEACESFAESLDLLPATTTKLRLAECLYQQGYLWKSWQLFDAIKRAATTPAHKRVAKLRAAEIEAQLAVVSIELDDARAPGLGVTVNGRDVSPRRRIRELVDPGQVSIEAYAANGARFVKTVRAKRGQVTTIRIPAIVQTVTRRRESWVTASKSIVFLGGAVFAGAGFAGENASAFALGGLATVGVGAAIYFAAPRDRLKRIIVTPTADSDSAGVAVTGSF